jgi:hypothetical protein
MLASDDDTAPSPESSHFYLPAYFFYFSIFNACDPFDPSISLNLQKEVVQLPTYRSRKRTRIDAAYSLMVRLPLAST